MAKIRIKIDLFILLGYFFYLKGHNLVPSKTFTWMLPAVGARSLRCFAIRSLGIRRRQPRNGDTITNAISIQSREEPSRYRVIGTWHDIAIICQTTWRMILLNPLDPTH